MTDSTHQSTVVFAKSKSMGTALVLTFFFGPLGLLYASVLGSVILMIAAVVVGLVTLGLGLPLVWIASMIWAAIAVNSSNDRMQTQAFASMQSARHPGGSAE